MRRNNCNSSTNPTDKQLLDRVLNMITTYKGNDGWTPVYIYEEYRDKVIVKLYDYIDGQGTRPNTYLNQYVYSGGFTKNRDLATNIKGVTGNSGEPGDVGPRGEPGAQGIRGLQGPEGPIGPKGDQGNIGLQGEKGDKGDKPQHQWDGTSISFENPDGTQGVYIDIKGKDGLDGEIGPRGIEGPRGIQGVQGIQGEDGPKGDIGPIGLTGEQGIQGIKGDKVNHYWTGTSLFFENPDGSFDSGTNLIGPKGDKGNDGNGINIVGKLDDPSELPTTGESGEAYLIEGSLWVWNGNIYENVGNIQGPKGDQGEQGEQGVSATLNVGNTTQGLAGTLPEVTQRGNPQARIFDFKIPKGDTGAKGDKGEIGANGIQGIQGIQGDPGNDADVTAENIEIALGYIPADQSELNNKVDKESDKGLSQENFTTVLKNKLDAFTATFTTALKTAYDSASTWVTANGTNVLSHLSSKTNPHEVTKTQVGLGNVDNTTDLAKPLSTATIAALADKVDKSGTKVLTDVNFSAAHETKLNGIAAGANNYTHPVTHPASIITQDASNRFTTDAEKTSWNAKATIGTAVSQVRSNADLELRYAPIRYKAVTTVNANRTIDIVDENSYWTLSGTRDVTVPTNATIAFPIGGRIDIEVAASGKATFIPSSGVTITSSQAIAQPFIDGFKVITLVKKGTNAWTLIG